MWKIPKVWCQTILINLKKIFLSSWVKYMEMFYLYLWINMRNAKSEFKCLPPNYSKLLHNWDLNKKKNKVLQVLMQSISAINCINTCNRTHLNEERKMRMNLKKYLLQKMFSFVVSYITYFDHRPPHNL